MEKREKERNEGIESVKRRKLKKGEMFTWSERNGEGCRNGKREWDTNTHVRERESVCVCVCVCV